MVIVVSHQKGGVGKSTVTTNLATALQKNKEVILIDLDSQHSTKLWSDLRVQNGLNEFECFYADSREAFDEITEKHNDKIILVDSGGFDSMVNRYSLAVADLIITPASASQLDVFGLDKFQEVLAQATESMGREFKSYVLINNISSQIKKDKQALISYCESKKEFEVFKTTFHSRIDYKRAYAKGMGVAEYSKKSPAAEELNSLAKEINKIIKEHYAI